MKITDRIVLVFMLIGLLSLCCRGTSHAQDAKGRHDPGSVAGMHYFQILVNHGLETIIGANLVMLSEMKAAPGLDQETLARGRTMMEQGKKTIQQILSGPEKQAMPEGSYLAYTHDLAAAMMKVVEVLERTKLDAMNQDTMTLHHFHLLFNQALQMATVGSNLIMVGKMGMKGDIVGESVDHGKRMLADARSTIIEIMGSKAMSDMHAREAGKLPEMGTTHKLAGAIVEVFDLLDEMFSDDTTAVNQAMGIPPAGGPHAYVSHAH